jgi:hypothetical protein
MTSSLQQLQRVLEFLDAHDWKRSRETSRFLVYQPPTGTPTAEGYELLVPRDPAGPEFARSIDNTVDAVASYYQMPFSSVEALLLPSSEVLSLKLEGEGFQGGAAPFPKFERMLEHLKRTITRTAAFVLTDDPVTQTTPNAARDFLNECWFMQTGRGSFVTRVALPVSGNFGALSLFRQPVHKEAIATTIRNVSALIGERVLNDDESLFTDQGLRDIQDVVSVGVLEEVAKLLRGAGARGVTFSFNRQGDERSIPFPPLTEDRLHNLDRFIAHVRLRLQATFSLQAQGRVFEVRRSRRRSSSSFVGILADVEGRQQLVTFRVERDELPVFLDLFRSGAGIRVEGRARRLRTQIRIEGDLAYDFAT